MAHSYIQIEKQYITDKEVEKIREFLLKQPRWRFLKDGEEGTRKKRYAKPGTKKQHWLWMEENQATSWDDFITEWGSRDTPPEERWLKTDRAHLIMPGELFLCDLVGGELWVGRLQRRGETFRAEKIALISDSMQRDYGNSFNGYAVLPKIK